MLGSLSFVRMLAANLVRARIARRTFVSPFAVVWHATHACNLRCSYCDDGRGRRYPDIGGRVMTTAEVKQVLSLAREAVSALYITGGEPLLRERLQFARRSRPARVAPRQPAFPPADLDA